MNSQIIQLTSVKSRNMMHNLNLLVIFLLLWQFANSMYMSNSTTKFDKSEMSGTELNIIGVAKSAAQATNFPIQIGTKFYHVETEAKLNWFEAANKCRELGGYLLNIESSEEMDAFLSLLPTGDQFLWTSVHCLAGNRKFISVTTGEPSYMRWHDGEPNNMGGIEDCVELKTRTILEGIAFNDVHCQISRNYICQAKTV